MATRDSGSYVYNATCDVCGWILKSDKLKKRWDGYMVCDKDWEPRHPSDFYKTQNDQHKLPFTRKDSNDNPNYGAAQGINWTNVLGTGTVTITSTYSLNPDTRILTYQIQTTITGNATVASAGGRYTFTAAYPIIAGSLSARTMSNDGRLLNAASGLSIIQAGSFGAQNTSFTTSGSYSY